MKTTINMTTSTHDTDRYKDAYDLRSFYKSRNIDGLELMFIRGYDIPEKIAREDIIGIHLSYYTRWVNHWRGEPGDIDRKTIIDKFRTELDNAEKLNAEYVVFHVGDVKTENVFTYKHDYTDDEVNESACELINELLDGKNYSFYFLIENLWWAGFSFTSYETTKKLLDGINYNKKGIMLDTGHLLHTNRSLRTQEEAVDYIHKMLDTHGDLCGYIKGIHLNQTLSGEYVDSILKNPPVLDEDPQKRYWQAASHVYKIDNHQPFTTDKIQTVVDRINPLFLTHELITSDLQEHTKHLDLQINALKR